MMLPMLPWLVRYHGAERTTEVTNGEWDWDERALPYIVSATGKTVIERVPQTTLHCGAYDAKADQLAQLIVRSVNAATRIHVVMDGTEWGADTLDAIADILRQEGFPSFREPATL
jgi:hypothetical protein